MQHTSKIDLCARYRKIKQNKNLEGNEEILKRPALWLARFVFSLFHVFDLISNRTMSEESYRPEDSIDLKGEEPTPPASDPKNPYEYALPEMNIDIE